MRVGPYVLHQELGRGASGVVYRGQSQSGVSVAVKVLAAQTQEVLDRFQREVRLHERLGEEAGFVRFLDMGLAEGRPYLVMPFLEGGTLRERLQRGPLSLPETLELGERLASALGKAHALGIVHRDLKPENVLFDRGGQAFLADLGLAKHFRRDVAGASQSVVLSRAGEVRGTVSYMAPEQLDDASSAGPAADVFALGAVLYECLSGYSVFEAPTQLELLVKVAEASHVPLPRSAASPSWLRGLVEECLAKDPQRRPPDGAALSARLSAGPRGAPRTFGRLVLGAGLSCLLVTIGGVFAASREQAGPGPSATPAQASPSPSATPAPEPQGAPFEELPAAWEPLRQGPQLFLEIAWRPAGAAPVEALSWGESGPALVTGGRLLLLGPGPALTLEELPPDARALELPAAGVNDSGHLALLREESLRVVRLESGITQARVELRVPGRAVALASAARLAVVAHGERLALYDALPAPGMGLSRPNLATLAGPPSLLVGGPDSVAAVHASGLTWVDFEGKVLAQRTFESAPVALACRPGTRRELLVATRAGRLHGLDASGALAWDLETGLASVRTMACGARFAALAGPSEVCLVDLDAKAVFARVDLGLLGTEVLRLALGPREAGLVLGTADGHVLRFALAPPGAPRSRRIRPAATLGDRRGRHAGWIQFVSAQEGRLLSADTTSALQLWDPATGRALRSFPVSARHSQVAWDGSDRVWVFDGSRAREFDLQTGHELRRLPSTQRAPLHAALAPGGDELVVLDITGELRIWNLRQERSETIPLRGQVAPRRVGLLPDGSLLLGYESGALELRQRDGVKAWTRRAGESPVVALEVLPEGTRALVGTRDGAVTLWSLPEGKELLRTSTEGRLTSLALRGERVLLGRWDGDLELRETVFGQQVWRVPAGVGESVQVAFASSDEALVGGHSGLVRRLAISDDASQVRDLWPALESWSGPPFALGYRGGTLTSVERGRLRSWDPQGRLSELPFGGVDEAQWGGGGFVAALQAPEGSAQNLTPLERWSFGPEESLTSTRALPYRPRALVERGPGQRRRSFVLSADGRVLACTALDGNRRRRTAIAFLETGRMRYVPKDPASYALALSPEGASLALYTHSDRQTQVWSTAEPSIQLRLKARSQRLVFLPGSPLRLVGVDGGGRFHIYDLETGAEMASFMGPSSRDFLVAVDPRGELLALAAEPGRVELWSAAGQPWGSLLLERPEHLASQLAFSEDGARLAVATARGRFEVFELPR